MCMQKPFGNKKRFVRFGKKKPLKYRNKKVTFDGREFDSRAEMRFYIELKQRVLNQEIESFECQPIVALFKDPLNPGRYVKYIPDFRVNGLDGSIYYVDVKGTITAEESTYRLKIKCFKHFYPDIELREYIYISEGKRKTNIY